MPTVAEGEGVVGQLDGSGESEGDLVALVASSLTVALSLALEGALDGTLVLAELMAQLVCEFDDALGDAGGSRDVDPRRRRLAADAMVGGEQGGGDGL